MLWVALHFRLPLPATLEPIAAWLCQFTPKVSLEPPQALLAEVQGSLRYLGGIEALLGRVRAGLAELDVEASLAFASTPRAALWRARAGQDVFEQLPLEVAGDAEAIAFLKSLGLSTMGEVMRLPRDGLARRGGQPLLDELDRALGALPEPRKFFVLPPQFEVRLELPGAVSQAEGVLFAARRLLLQLEGLLAARQAGVRGFTLTLFHVRKKTRLPIQLASPARDTRRFSSLLHEKLSAVSLLEPVEAIGLEARDFTPLAGRTAGMFGDAQADEEDWAKLVERLQGRLGHGAVHGLATQPDHRPEHAWRRVEPGEWDPREFVQPGPRPTWLLEPPRRLAQGDFESQPEPRFEILAGPERIECGWWDGDDAKRDYFVARSPDAALLWVYRDAGEWFLHGVFA